MQGMMAYVIEGASDEPKVYSNGVRYDEKAPGTNQYAERALIGLAQNAPNWLHAGNEWVSWAWGCLDAPGRIPTGETWLVECEHPFVCETSTNREGWMRRE